MAAVGPRLLIAGSRRGLPGRAGIRLKHRAAVAAELRCILPQARDDSIAVGYLIPAKPENVGGAGKLLGKGSPILLGKNGILKGNAADSRHRKAQGKRVYSHIRSFSLGLG